MDISLQQQLLSSTVAIHNKTRYYGNADVIKLSALHMIYDLLGGCLDINHKCIVKLSELAQKLIISDENICNIRGIEPDFIQSRVNDTITSMVITNTAPTVDGDSYTWEDNGVITYTFSPDNFKVNFTDAEGDLPHFVRIVTLPTIGSLTYDGNPVSAGDVFLISNAGLLVYTRDDAIYQDIFTFQTSDNNATNKLFSNMANFTLNIDGKINEPPTEVGDGSASTSYNTTITFTRAMFTTATTPAYSDPEGDAAALLKVLTLPAQGTLKLNGVDVTVNQEIDFADIDSGLFTYVPDPAVTTAHSPDFTFSIADAGSGTFVS